MECTHSFIDTTWSETIDGKAYAIAVHCARPGCNARLSLGPSNDADVPADEIIAAVCAHSDADHAAFEALDGWPWDETKPIAEQWPWNGTKPDPAAESHLELTGPTDQGQPILDGGMTGYIDQAQLDRLKAMCTPVKTLPLRVVLDGGEPFDVGDHAATQPWVDPGAETKLTNDELGELLESVSSSRLTDAELVETVAYSQPGSVRE